jgi:very-long-chain (3R)-3-hydroxyacyl-CoA dehydratase
MTLAWSITEVIRYPFYFFSLRGAVPEILTWLRYNAFLILYPLGVGSEMWLIYSSLGDAAKVDEKLPWLFYGILASYAPGFYMLFGYMLKQRRRIGRGKAVKRS